MDRRIIIRHVSGSRAGEVQEFPLKHFRELAIGREPSCAIRFDPDKDDLVSRRHAAISFDKDNPERFLLSDFGSTNGTFLNNRRIGATAALAPGDEIRCGANGPSLRFDLYPPPADAGRTRLDTGSAGPAGGPKATRLAASQASRAAGPIGKETLEFTVGQAKGSLLKTIINGGAVLLGILILVGGYLAYQNRETANTVERVGEEIGRTRQGMAQTGAAIGELKSAKSAAEIFEEFAPTTVLIEVSWKLVSAEANKDVCHRHVTLQGKRFALYVDLGDGGIEPWLEPGYCDTDETIGKIGAGTGFVAHRDGYILTNSHVASPWLIPYALNREENSLLCPLTLSAGDAKVKCRRMDSRKVPRDWVPEKSTQLGGKRIDWKLLRGMYNYLYVTFPATDIRIEASLVNSSEVADVAQIKVNLPQELKTVKLSTDDGAVRAGNPVIVLGYPSVSPEVYERRMSQNPTKYGEVFSKVPNPTVTDGSISNVIPGVPLGREKSDRELMSSFGDTYQLTINSTGHGNSGGPVFDSRGEVIGIFTYGMQAGGAAVTKAVPIRYGRDLMNIQSVFH